MPDGGRCEDDDEGHTNGHVGDAAATEDGRFCGFPARSSPTSRETCANCLKRGVVAAPGTEVSRSVGFEED